MVVKKSCQECSCTKNCVVAVLVCMTLFILFLIGFLVYYLGKYFGVQYFFKGAYHYDFTGDRAEAILYPQPFVPGEFQKQNALAVMSSVRIAINIPKFHEMKDRDVKISLPDGIELETVWGSDGKVYGVFLHFVKHQITILCFINLRYLKQWRCLVDTNLVSPFYDKKFPGKCWSCINYFYGLVRENAWQVWEEKFSRKTSQFVIAGHSLGGAMAPIAALDFRLNDEGLNSNNLFVYISGAPRCGDEKFVVEYNKQVPNTWNIMNTYDLITLSPPLYSKSTPFAHVGTEVYFSYPHPNGLGASHLHKSYLRYFQQDGKVSLNK